MVFLWSDVDSTAINRQKVCSTASNTWYLARKNWIPGLETVTSSSGHEHVLKQIKLIPTLTRYFDRGSPSLRSEHWQNHKYILAMYHAQEKHMHN